MTDDQALAQAEADNAAGMYFYHDSYGFHRGGKCVRPFRVWRDRFAASNDIETALARYDAIVARFLADSPPLSNVSAHPAVAKRLRAYIADGLSVPA